MEDALAELLSMADEEEEEKNFDDPVNTDVKGMSKKQSACPNKILKSEFPNSEKDINDSNVHENAKSTKADNYPNVPLIDMDYNRNEIKTEINSALEQISHEIQADNQKHLDNLEADDLDSFSLEWTYNTPSAN